MRYRLAAVRFNDVSRRGVVGSTISSWCGGIAVIAWFGLCAGCSCSKRPEWDPGLRNVRNKDAGQAGGASRGREQGPQGGAGSGHGGAGQGGSGQGAGGGAKGGDGLAAGQGVQGGGSESGKGGESGAAEGAAGAGTDGSPAGGAQADGGPVAGNDAGTAAGTADDSSQSAAALPGRPRPKPRYDAPTAADVAEKHLQRAARNKAAGDRGNAYAEAIEAFEAVEPHAETDDSCRLVLARAKRMCEDLAEIQNRESRPQPVPTLFE